MPSPETTDLRARGQDELHTELEETHQALFNLRFQAATRQLADVSQVRKARRRIARIRTLLTEREIIVESDQVIAVEASADADEPTDAGEPTAGAEPPDAGAPADGDTEDAAGATGEDEGEE